MLFVGSAAVLPQALLRQPHVRSQRKDLFVTTALKSPILTPELLVHPLASSKLCIFEPFEKPQPWPTKAEFEEAPPAASFIGRKKLPVTNTASLASRVNSTAGLSSHSSPAGKGSGPSPKLNRDAAEERDPQPATEVVLFRQVLGLAAASTHHKDCTADPSLRGPGRGHPLTLLLPRWITAIAGVKRLQLLLVRSAWSRLLVNPFPDGTQTPEVFRRPWPSLEPAAALPRSRPPAHTATHCGEVFPPGPVR